MNARHLMLTLAWIALPASICAQVESESLGGSIKACFDRTTTAASVAECIAKGTRIWDLQLQETLDELLRRLDPERRQRLQTAQSQWNRFREAEHANITGIYGALEGTAFLVIAAEDQMELVKSRTLQLKKYLELVRLGR